jgi:hypothetical protein
MRGSQPCKKLREYEITDGGVRLLGQIEGFEGRITGRRT